MVLVSKTKRRTSVHHKRRHGEHHKRSHDYSKPYWPYLPIAFIIGLGVFANTFWSTVQHAILGYSTNTSVSGLVSETNSQRAAGSLGALAVSSKLNHAAQAKANDMAARNYWSHNTPEGNPPWVFFANAGYDYTAAGENLAYGFDNSGETLVAWMNSPGHRANIMNGEFTEVGFGMANVENYQDTGPQTVVVAMYGTPKVAAAATPAPAAPAKAQPAPKPAPAAEQPPAPVEQPAPATASPASSPDIVVAAESTEVAPASQTVARIQLLTAAATPWTILAITVLATVAIAAVFLRHSLVWHRTLLRGEQFILRHKFLDVALVLVGVVGFVLTRTAGSIH